MEEGGIPGRGRLDGFTVHSVHCPLCKVDSRGMGVDFVAGDSRGSVHACGD